MKASNGGFDFFKSVECTILQNEASKNEGFVYIEGL